jgi:hypothetical protein
MSESGDGNVKIPTHSWDFKIISFLMILFGLAEILTGITHKFLVLSTSTSTLATYAGVVIGLFYLIGGLLILTGKKRWAFLAIFLLMADILGRAAMVVTGLYPFNTTHQIWGMVIGTSIAIYFAFYVGKRLKFFR